MAANLRPWLLPFLRQNMQDAVEWRQLGKRAAVGWEDTSSNIRKMITFDDTSDKFLQLLEFARTERPIKWRVSDGQTNMIALVDANVEAAFPKEHHGKSISQVAPGSIFTVAAVEVVITEHGNPEEHITLKIHECYFEGTTVRLGTVGRPVSAFKHSTIQTLHGELYDDGDEDSLSILNYDGTNSPHTRKIALLNNQKRPQSSESDADSTRHQDSGDDVVGSHFATQLAPSRKRKRVSEAEESARDNPPVDVKRYSKQPRPIVNDLMSLLPNNRPAKRGHIQEVRQGSREQSSPSEDESHSEDSEAQSVKGPHGEAEELPTGDDNQTLPFSEMWKVPQPASTKAAWSSQRPWHHMFGSAGNLFHIPKEQLHVLKVSSSWNPPPAGKQFPHGNLPTNVLQEIQENNLTESKRALMQKSPAKPLVESPSKSRPSSSVVSEIRTDDFMDEEDELLPWSPSQRDGDGLPPDSSPNLLVKSSASSDIAMAVPRALVRSTHSESRINKEANESTILQEEDVANIDSDVPADVQQIHREVLERSRTTNPASSGISRPSPFKTLSHIRPGSKSSEGQSEPGSSGVSNVINNSPHQRRLEIRSPDSRNTTCVEQPETPLFSPSRHIEAVVANTTSGQQSRPTSQISSPNSRIVASVEQPPINDAEPDPDAMEEHENQKPSSTIHRLSPQVGIKFKGQSPDVKYEPATPLNATPSAKHPRMNQVELVRRPSSGRTSLSSASFTNAQRAVYESFIAAYPEYRGDIEHFISMCRKIREAQPHRAVWDDFVIRHLSEYASYVSSRLMKGLDVLEYAQYHNKTVKALSSTKGVLTEEVLESMFPVSKGDRKKRMDKPPIKNEQVDLTNGNGGPSKSITVESSLRDSGSSSNKSRSSKNGHLFLPNANTYWTKNDGWIVNGRSRGSAADQEVKNAF